MVYHHIYLPPGDVPLVDRSRRPLFFPRHHGLPLALDVLRERISNSRPFKQFLLLSAGSFTGKSSVTEAGGVFGCITAFIAFCTGVLRALCRDRPLTKILCRRCRQRPTDPRLCFSRVCFRSALTCAANPGHFLHCVAHWGSFQERLKGIS